MNLDDKDRKIISALKENSRLSTRDIAKKFGLKHSTVHQRIQKLQKNKVIEKFTLKLNNKAVGNNIIAFISITTSENFQRSLFKEKNITEIFSVTGDFEFILKTKFQEMRELNKFLVSLRKKGVRKISSVIATDEIKEEI